MKWGAWAVTALSVMVGVVGFGTSCKHQDRPQAAVVLLTLPPPIPSVHRLVGLARLAGSAPPEAQEVPLRSLIPLLPDYASLASSDGFDAAGVSNALAAARRKHRAEHQYAAEVMAKSYEGLLTNRTSAPPGDDLIELGIWAVLVAEVRTNAPPAWVDPQKAWPSKEWFNYFFVPGCPKPTPSLRSLLTADGEHQAPPVGAAGISLAMQERWFGDIGRALDAATRKTLAAADFDAVVTNAERTVTQAYAGLWPLVWTNVTRDCGDPKAKAKVPARIAEIVATTTNVASVRDPRVIWELLDLRRTPGAKVKQVPEDVEGALLSAACKFAERKAEDQKEGASVGALRFDEKPDWHPVRVSRTLDARIRLAIEGTEILVNADLQEGWTEAARTWILGALAIVEQDSAAHNALRTAIACAMSPADLAWLRLPPDAKVGDRLRRLDCVLAMQATVTNLLVVPAGLGEMRARIAQNLNPEQLAWLALPPTSSEQDRLARLTAYVSASVDSTNVVPEPWRPVGRWTRGMSADSPPRSGSPQSAVYLWRLNDPELELDLLNAYRDLATTRSGPEAMTAAARQAAGMLCLKSTSSGGVAVDGPPTQGTNTLEVTLARADRFEKQIREATPAGLVGGWAPALSQSNLPPANARRTTSLSERLMAKAMAELMRNRAILLRLPVADPWSETNRAFGLARTNLARVLDVRPVPSQLRDALRLPEGAPALALEVALDVSDRFVLNVPVVVARPKGSSVALYDQSRIGYPTLEIQGLSLPLRPADPDPPSQTAVAGRRGRAATPAERRLLECSDSPLLSVDDIAELPGLAGDSGHGPRPIDKWLTERALAGIASYKRTNDSRALMRVTVVNDILRGDSIYDEARFAGILLRQETAELLSRQPVGGDLVRLNRLLLEDAYPQHVARMSGLGHLADLVTDFRWIPADSQAFCGQLARLCGSISNANEGTGENAWLNWQVRWDAGPRAEPRYSGDTNTLTRIQQCNLTLSFSGIVDPSGGVHSRLKIGDQYYLIRGDGVILDADSATPAARSRSSPGANRLQWNHEPRIELLVKPDCFTHGGDLTSEAVQGGARWLTCRGSVQGTWFGITRELPSVSVDLELPTQGPSFRVRSLKVADARLQTPEELLPLLIARNELFGPEHRLRVGASDVEILQVLSNTDGFEIHAAVTAATDLGPAGDTTTLVRRLPVLHIPKTELSKDLTDRLRPECEAVARQHQQLIQHLSGSMPTDCGELQRAIRELVPRELGRAKIECTVNCDGLTNAVRPALRCQLSFNGDGEQAVVVVVAAGPELPGALKGNTASLIPLLTLEDAQQLVPALALVLGLPRDIPLVKESELTLRNGVLEAPVDFALPGLPGATVRGRLRLPLCFGAVSCDQLSLELDDLTARLTDLGLTVTLQQPRFTPCASASLIESGVKLDFAQVPGLTLRGTLRVGRDLRLSWTFDTVSLLAWLRPMADRGLASFFQGILGDVEAVQFGSVSLLPADGIPKSIRIQNVRLSVDCPVIDSSLAADIAGVTLDLISGRWATELPIHFEANSIGLLGVFQAKNLKLTISGSEQPERVGIEASSLELGGGVIRIMPPEEDRPLALGIPLGGGGIELRGDLQLMTDYSIGSINVLVDPRNRRFAFGASGTLYGLLALSGYADVDLGGSRLAIGGRGSVSGVSLADLDLLADWGEDTYMLDAAFNIGMRWGGGAQLFRGGQGFQAWASVGFDVAELRAEGGSRFIKVAIDTPLGGAYLRFNSWSDISLDTLWAVIRNLLDPTRWLMAILNFEPGTEFNLAGDPGSGGSDGSNGNGPDARDDELPPIPGEGGGSSPWTIALDGERIFVRHASRRGQHTFGLQPTQATFCPPRQFCKLTLTDWFVQVPCGPDTAFSEVKELALEHQGARYTAISEGTNEPVRVRLLDSAECADVRQLPLSLLPPVGNGQPPPSYRDFYRSGTMDELILGTVLVLSGRSQGEDRLGIVLGLGTRLTGANVLGMRYIHREDTDFWQPGTAVLAGAYFAGYSQKEDQTHDFYARHVYWWPAPAAIGNTRQRVEDRPFLPLLENPDVPAQGGNDRLPFASHSAWDRLRVPDPSQNHIQRLRWNSLTRPESATLLITAEDRAQMTIPGGELDFDQAQWLGQQGEWLVVHVSQGSSTCTGQYVVFQERAGVLYWKFKCQESANLAEALNTGFPEN